jgi:formylglycine-generating enzyme required for sulfatase activity
MLLPGVLLACSLLSACGASPDPESTAEIAPEPVDPAGLEADVEELAQEAEPEPDAGEWMPDIVPVPASEVRSALRAAAKAVEQGQLVGADPAAAPPDVEDGGEAADAAAADPPVAETPVPTALEIYLGILATNPDQAEALAGVEAISSELIALGRKALAEGRVVEGQRYERIVSRASPQHEALAAYRQTIETAQRARDLTARGDARFRAGRFFKPENRSALAAYREATLAFPGYVPAQDGLVRLQSYHLNRALAAAQAGEYPQSEQWMADAARVLPDSPAQQDMAARIVELRQGRTAQLLAQGHAAVDALDLELAARRLDEAERVSLQAPGLDALKQRIELARHYGRFRPGQVFRDPLAVGGEGPEMVVLAHGSFRMGSPDDEPQRQDNEGPQFTVEFRRGFALARNETTVEEFGKFVEATDYRSLATRRGRSTVYDERGGVMSEHSRVDWRRDHAGNPAAPDLPVVHVAFQDAEAYVAWLSAQTGERYRLPSEAEFEYALRGGRSEAYAWGSGAPVRVVGNLTGDGDQSRLKRRWSNAIADYSDGHWGPAPVRSFPAEAFGTFDLIGNVSEWVQDCWHDSYRRAPTDGSAWVNPGCSDRVIRGASWASTLDRARSAYRQSTPAETTHARLGFRVAREL